MRQQIQSFIQKYEKIKDKMWEKQEQPLSLLRFKKKKTYKVVE